MTLTRHSEAKVPNRSEWYNKYIDANKISSFLGFLSYSANPITAIICYVRRVVNSQSIFVVLKRINIHIHSL